MLDVVRGLVRPVVTLGVVAVWSFLVITQVVGPGEYITMAMGAVSFWFAQRTPPNGGHP